MKKTGSKILIVVLFLLFPVTMFVSSLVRAAKIKKDPGADRSLISLAWDLFTRKFRY